MNTQIVFKIDKKLKDSARRKAHSHGVSLSAVLKEATRSYVEGKMRMGVVHDHEIPNAKTARELDQALNDVRLGRNMSPAFDNAEAAIKYLEKYSKKHGN